MPHSGALLFRLFHRIKAQSYHLAQVERHIREGERHIFRQREIVNELERHGHGNSQTAKMARDILDSFEMTQLAHLSDRAHLMQALREIT